MPRTKWYILAVLLVSVLFVWSLFYSRTTSGELTVSFLDVGQGDAIFIESPNGSQVLIDGGPGRSVLRGLGHEMGFFDRTLDVVIATHPDADHIGGLPDVLERYMVSYVIDSEVLSDTDVYETLLDVSEKEGAQLISARRGQIINLGDGAYLRILFPDRDVSNVESNSASIIVQLVYGNTKFLMTGDSPVSIEQYISALDGKTLKSDVLKVGHHGSKTSSSELFVGWTNPEYAVISRGCNNRYGHPHKEVLEILERFEIEILDTCEKGTITFTSDGSRVSLK